MNPSLPLLTAIVALPVAGALALLGLGRGRDALVRQVALGISLVTFVLSLALVAGFDAS